MPTGYQNLTFHIKVKARDTQSYRRDTSWVAHPNARRAFIDEILDMIEDHAKDNHLLITETTVLNAYEEEEFDG